MRVVPLVLLGLALAGCGQPGAPTAGDDEVEVIVASQSGHPVEYGVQVLMDGDIVVLYDSFTLANGEREVGAVAPGAYEVKAQADGASAQRAVKVASSDVVYVHHAADGALRIIVEALGE